MITNSGLVSTPAPGSIFAYLAVTPRGGHLSVLMSIAVAAGVAFVVGAALLKFGRGSDADDPELAAAVAGAPPVPSGDNGSAGATAGAVTAPARPVVSAKDVSTLMVACDAGMGSSVMLASQLRTRLQPYGVAVEHVPINELPGDSQLVLTHADLADRARAVAPRAVIVPFRMFLGDPVFDEVERAFKEGGELRG
jgi:PTS system mannitol-specific IIC component